MTVGGAARAGAAGAGRVTGVAPRSVEMPREQSA